MSQLIINNATENASLNVTDGFMGMWQPQQCCIVKFHNITQIKKKWDKKTQMCNRT